MPKLREIRHEIKNEILNDYINACGGVDFILYPDNLPDNNRYKILTDRKKLVEILNYSEPEMELLGIEDYALVIRYDLKIEYMNPKKLEKLSGYITKITEVVVDKVKEWGINFPDGWEFCIEGVYPDKDKLPINKLIICPIERYYLSSELNVVSDNQEYEIGRFKSETAPFSGVLKTRHLEYGGNGKVSINNMPLKLDYGDPFIKPEKQLTTGIVYSCLSEFIEKCMNNPPAIGEQDDIVGAESRFVYGLVNDGYQNLQSKKALVSSFYKNPYSF